MEMEDMEENDETIQCALENAFRIQLRPIYGARLGLSSRTDGGVHAIINTAHVDLTHPYSNTIYKPSFITDSLNQYLARNGHEIRILNTRLVPKSFHSRSDAKWRSYVYRLAILDQQIDPKSTLFLDSLLPISELNRCHIIRLPNFAQMEKVINLFNGRHDFASFIPKSKSKLGKESEEFVDTIRVMEVFEFKKLNDFVWINEEKINSNISLWIFNIKAKSYFYNQIRRMVGSVIDVGLDRYSYEGIKWLLENPSHLNFDPRLTLAPAKGLWLTNVFYDENDFSFKESDDDFTPYNTHFSHENDDDSQ